WSHSLLDDWDRVVFRRLGVLVGSWELSAAEAVAGETDALERLRSLVCRSLVVRSPSGRFSMLEIVREFALEQLTSAGEQAAARDAHAAHYGVLLEDCEPDRLCQHERRTLCRLDAECDNFYAALSWLAIRGDGDALARAAWNLRWYWTARGTVVEGRRWLQ